MAGTASLWREGDFFRLWAGQTISLLGSQVTSLAIALTAALYLHASPTEMGLIGSLNVLPQVLVGLPAGVWIDRVRRKPVLIWTDIGRAALLLSIPLAALMHVLAMPQVYVVSFALGVLTIVFRVAYGALLPSVVRRDQLAEGNARMTLAEAIARVCGPAVAGGLVQLLTAPLAIFVDCASFVVSAISLAAIRTREEHAVQHRGQSLRSSLAQGVRTVFRHPLLRPLFIGVALGNTSDGLIFQSGILVLFFTRELHMEPASLGAVFAGLGIGGLIGAALASAIRNTIGVGPTILGSFLLWALAYGGTGFIPDVAGSPLMAAGLLGALGAINPISAATISTVRQLVTPQDRLGRVVAVANVGSLAALTVGSFAGGLVAETIGLRATLIIGGCLPLVGLGVMLLSAVVRVKSLGELSYGASA